MILAAVPLWMSEVVPPVFRGALVNVHAISLLLGYASQGWVGFGFYFWKEGGNNAWRVPLALQCAWPLILLLGLRWVPESRERKPFGLFACRECNQLMVCQRGGLHYMIELTKRKLSLSDCTTTGPTRIIRLPLMNSMQ